MASQGTEEALAAITDDGKFERIATAVLRIADPLCFGLSHPGVTARGKTRKALLDGVGFVRGADPPHLVAAHHTTTQGQGLQSKWLNDPAKVKPRRGRTTPSAPAGDLLKTAVLINDERARTADLKATLFLTTNTEPDERLIRDVQAAARARGFEVDVWSRSRLAQVLDVNPDGQWVRALYLGVPPERLSRDLLADLCRRSLESFAPPDDPRGWVSRSLDRTLADIQRPVTLLAAPSGLGKSVACYRTLKRHVDSGGFGLVLPHDVLASATSLDQALGDAFRRLHPLLSIGERPLSLCDRAHPMLIVVEDVNVSGEPERLLERLATWASAERGEKADGSWRMLCPVWPEVIARLRETARKAVEPLLLTPAPFTAEEGAAAVVARAGLQKRALGRGAALRLSEALGHDPLLIALHEGVDAAEASKVIASYVGRAVQRVAAIGRDPVAVSEALRALGGEMLARRRLDPSWREVRSWGMSASTLDDLRALALRQETLRLEGDPSDPVLRFRHDRVRDWLLVDSACALFGRDRLAPEIVADPYFAEILGGSLARIEPPGGLLQALANANPLALFHSLRLCRQHDSRRTEIAAALSAWLADPANRDDDQSHLRWAAQLVIADTEGPEVVALAQAFPSPWVAAWMGRLRNGDLGGAISIFANNPLGRTWAGMDDLVDDVKLRFGNDLVAPIDLMLRDPTLFVERRIGLVRFAGYLGDPRLAAPLQAAWHVDAGRTECLADYLWALARCCEAHTAADLLDPICDVWAEMPDTEAEKGMGSPRSSMAADRVRMEFGRHIPVGALRYFIERAAMPDLSWPITYMLHEVDHPLVLTFFAEAMARRDDEIGQNGWDFHPASNHWGRMQDEGTGMSPASRAAMERLWTNTDVRPSLRRAAFLFWASVQEAEDLAPLRRAEGDADLGDRVLRARAYRADPDAVPLIVDRLRDRAAGWTWWHAAASAWDAAFIQPLIEAIDRAVADAADKERNDDIAWTLAQMLEWLTPAQAEAILVPRWPGLGRWPRFFQKALYFATPRLLALAAEVVSTSEDPKPLFDHLGGSYGLNWGGRPGIQREVQIQALAPYLDYVDEPDLSSLALVCNEAGWFEHRRRLLDPRIDNRRAAWRPTDTANACDEMVKHGRVLWVEQELDMALKTGVAWPDLRDQIEAWYRARGDLIALELFAQAMQHRGVRGDLGKLEILPEMNPIAAAAIVDNATFTVCRRSAK